MELVAGYFFPLYRMLMPTLDSTRCSRLYEKMRLAEPILTLFSSLAVAPSQDIPLLPIFAIVEPSATVTGSPTSQIWASTTMSLPLDPVQTVYAASSTEREILFRFLKDGSETVLEMSFPRDILRNKCIDISRADPTGVFPTPPGWLGTITPGKVWPVAPSTLTLPTAEPTNFALRTENNQVLIVYYVGNHEYELEVPVTLNIMKQFCERYGDMPGKPWQSQPTTMRPVGTTGVWASSSISNPFRSRTPSRILFTGTITQSLRVPSNSPSTSPRSTGSAPRATPTLSRSSQSTALTAMGTPFRRTSTPQPWEPSKSHPSSASGSVHAVTPLPHLFHPNRDDEAENGRRVTRLGSVGGIPVRTRRHVTTTTLMVPIYEPDELSEPNPMMQRGEQTALGPFTCQSEVSTQDPSNAAAPRPGTLLSTVGGADWAGWWPWKQMRSSIQGCAAEQSVMPSSSLSTPTPPPTAPSPPIKPRTHDPTTYNTTSSSAFNVSELLPFFNVVTSYGSKPTSLTSLRRSHTTTTPTGMLSVPITTRMRTSTSTATPSATATITDGNEENPSSTELLVPHPPFPPASYPSSPAVPLPTAFPPFPTAKNAAQPPETILPGDAEEYHSVMTFTYAGWGLIGWMLLSGIWRIHGVRRPPGVWWVGQRLWQRFEARVVWAWWG
ncbi:uncharacterized protein EI97DRAFT_446615 [Westerdykella ornata]|uniref:Uncharacterized protein n=1 Tax=Westerdykella ornata TaxID=318751 RepID=A0A6A6J4B3_WESOR|nr:uncharacterized protein EI97DRAFT_446615 [Westerdykella ornata]KAF2271421.1 hypothetical protein EI97DRAFT_446615 [Westerdykella ornata]